MTRYRNPVIPGFYPDPSICRVGDDYYLVTSTFEYFPCLPIFHSKDLVHWNQIGYAISNPSYLDLSEANNLRGLYAPTIRYHDGWFYIICTNVPAGGHFIVKAKDPTSEWSAPLWIDLKTQHAMTFDPSLFFGNDGVVYFTYFSTDGIMQALIDPDTGQLLTPLRRIADSVNGFTSEGPHLYRINNTYYLMTADGGTEYGHMETIARADNPWGPFTPCPHNPILTHRSLHHPIQVTGHGDLVQDQNGNWWMVFLAVRPHDYQPVHHLGRETYLAPVRWDEHGWPYIPAADLEMDAPLPAWTPLNSFPSRACFDTPVLDLCWNFIRNPAPESWTLTEHPGCLRLRGLPATLNNIAPIAFLGRRQQHFTVKVATPLDFSPQSENHEAGLVIRMNEGHHYEIFKTIRNGGPCLVVRRTIGTLIAETASVHSPASSPVTLSVHADPDWYHLGYIQGDHFIELGKAETRYLSTEVARGFTGVYFGMYASGNGEKSPIPADFAWFDYEPDD